MLLEDLECQNDLPRHRKDLKHGARDGYELIGLLSRVAIRLGLPVTYVHRLIEDIANDVHLTDRTATQMEKSCSWKELHRHISEDKEYTLKSVVLSRWEMAQTRKKIDEIDQRCFIHPGTELLGCPVEWATVAETEVRNICQKLSANGVELNKNALRAYWTGIGKTGSELERLMLLAKDRSDFNQEHNMDLDDSWEVVE